MISSDIIVKRTDSLIYTAELPRLERRLVAINKALKQNRTKEGLQVYTTSVEAALLNSITRVSHSGLVLGAKQVLFPIGAGDEIRLKRQNAARAKQAALWIATTTANALDIQSAFDVKQALSRIRAFSDAVNELSLSFYLGVNIGWSLNPNARKRWRLSSLHDDDDICDSNAEQGPIKVSQSFASGDFIPPAHINCVCELALSIMKPGVN